MSEVRDNNPSVRVGSVGMAMHSLRQRMDGSENPLSESQIAEVQDWLRSVMTVEQNAVDELIEISKMDHVTMPCPSCQATHALRRLEEA